MLINLQIFNFEKYEIKSGDFLYDWDFYRYLDTNDKVVHQEFKITKKYPNKRN